jgi:hypothetical protein
MPYWRRLFNEGFTKKGDFSIKCAIFSEVPAQGRSLRLPLRGLYGQKSKPKRARKARFPIAAMENTHFLRVSFDIFQDYLI